MNQQTCGTLAYWCCDTSSQGAASSLLKAPAQNMHMFHCECRPGCEPKNSKNWMHGLSGAEPVPQHDLVNGKPWRSSEYLRRMPRLQRVWVGMFSVMYIVPFLTNTCDNVRVHSATEWTASVHTAHMSKPVINVRVHSATEWTALVHTPHGDFLRVQNYRSGNRLKTRKSRVWRVKTDVSRILRKSRCMSMSHVSPSFLPSCPWLPCCICSSAVSEAFLSRL